MRDIRRRGSLSRDLSFEAAGQHVVVSTGRSAEHVEDAATALGLRALIVVASARRQEGLGPLVDRLGKRFVGFVSGSQHVPVELAEAAVERARSAGADGLICVGGGSATGLAKAVAVATGLPIIAVPTTLSGSEVTSTWGITSGGVKRVEVDSRALPRWIVYDTTLLAELPPDLLATSAFNALAHAMEATWAPRSNPLGDALAYEAIQRLTAIRSRPNDIVDLVLGAFLAGSAFASAGSGLHHRICHILGGSFGLDHSSVHAVMLPRVISFNEHFAPDQMRRIARALGGLSAGSAINELAGAAGVPRTLSALGLDDHGRRLAIDAIAQQLPITNPRRVTKDDIEALLAD